MIYFHACWSVLLLLAVLVYRSHYRYFSLPNSLLPHRLSWHWHWLVAHFTPFKVPNWQKPEPTSGDRKHWHGVLESLLTFLVPFTIAATFYAGLQAWLDTTDHITSYEKAQYFELEQAIARAKIFFGRVSLQLVGVKEINLVGLALILLISIAFKIGLPKSFIILLPARFKNIMGYGKKVYTLFTLLASFTFFGTGQSDPKSPYSYVNQLKMHLAQLIKDNDILHKQLENQVKAEVVKQLLHSADVKKLVASHRELDSATHRFYRHTAPFYIKRYAVEDRQSVLSKRIETNRKLARRTKDRIDQWHTATQSPPAAAATKSSNPFQPPTPASQPAADLTEREVAQARAETQTASNDYPSPFGPYSEGVEATVEAAYEVSLGELLKEGLVQLGVQDLLASKMVELLVLEPLQKHITERVSNYLKIKFTQIRAGKKAQQTAQELASDILKNNAPSVAQEATFKAYTASETHGNQVLTEQLTKEAIDTEYLAQKVYQAFNGQVDDFLNNNTDFWITSTSSLARPTRYTDGVTYVATHLSEYKKYQVPEPDTKPSTSTTKVSSEPKDVLTTLIHTPDFFLPKTYPYTQEPGFPFPNSHPSVYEPGSTHPRTSLPTYEPGITYPGYIPPVRTIPPVIVERPSLWGRIWRVARRVRVPI